jgi:hypothetical protein
MEVTRINITVCRKRTALDFSALRAMAVYDFPYRTRYFKADPAAQASAGILIFAHTATRLVVPGVRVSIANDLNALYDASPLLALHR